MDARDSLTPIPFNDKLHKHVLFLIFLAVAGLIFSGFLITTWCINAKEIEHNVDLSSKTLRSQLRSEIKNTRSILQPLSSSATNLAKVLSSSKDANTSSSFSFSRIKTNVAPLLFEAFSIVPHASQVSYTDKSGLFFSYFADGDRLVAAYSNSSCSSGNNDLSWYTQQVNRDNGELFGEITKTCPLISIDSGWFRATVNNPDGYSTVENGWNNAHELLFVTAAGVGRRGIVTVGFTVQNIMKFFTNIEFYGGKLFLSTKDQKGLLQGFPNTSMTVNNNAVSFRMVQYDNVTIHIGDVLCDNDDGLSNLTAFKIQDTEYKFYCSSIDILGVPSVYALAFRRDGLASLVTRKLKFSLGLVELSVSIMFIIVSAFIFITIKGSRKILALRSLLKQEKLKSASLSHAIAGASHDIRANLAGITGLIDMCYDNVADVSSNLRKIKSVTNDLQDFLNSIIDTSKIEAGKMQQLEEKEFDLIELIEDVVDLFYPVGIKKGVDVVFDTCDGSVKNFSRVKGDEERLKRVLWNLLSNAVKFTSDGHISVRAWVKEQSSEKSIIDFHQGATWNCISCLFRKKDSSVNLKTVSNRQNQNSMEFVFEVDDTGKGIPKDEHQSVFEYYVQAAETVGGTGLGLGIVRTVVRLMGGEIGIVDKEIGERGTCFRFNVFLTVCERRFSDNAGDNDIELGGSDVIPHYANQYRGPAMFTSRTERTTFSLGPKFSPRKERSRVFLLIQNDERRRIVQRYMENQGVEVISVSQWEDLLINLEKIKYKLDGTRPSLSEMFKLDSRSDLTCSVDTNDTITTEKDIMLGATNATDFSRESNARLSKFVLIVIDSRTIPSPERYKAFVEIKRELGSNGPYRIVWLKCPFSSDTTSISALNPDQDDIIISKPLHGKCLFDLMKILPEFSGSWHVNPALSTTTSDIKEVFASGSSTRKSLNGKIILMVEDNRILQKVTCAKLKKHGATIEICVNGEEAVDLVSKGLSKQRSEGTTFLPPYDYILMDCEMPVMNGYEATKKIRHTEKEYGVHIPIIALTAHSSGEADKITEAGMDAHLVKPFDVQVLLDKIQNIN